MVARAFVDAVVPAVVDALGAVAVVRWKRNRGALERIGAARPRAGAARVVRPTRRWLRAVIVRVIGAGRAVAVQLWNFTRHAVRWHRRDAHAHRGVRDAVRLGAAAAVDRVPARVRPPAEEPVARRGAARAVVVVLRNLSRRDRRRRKQTAPS